jgi:transposase
MSRTLEANWDEELLLPPRVEDWVGERHLARFVREFVAALDLEALGFNLQVKATGRPGFTCACLLSAWLYGYLIKQPSTRNLERVCCSDMGAIWLTGNHQPDHNTLWTFFKTYRKELKGILKSTVHLGCRMGLVDLNIVAVDGTKLKASASRDGAIWSKQLQWADAALEEEIESYLRRVEAEGNSEGLKLPENLAERKALQDAIRETLAELESLGTAGLSPVDPDARTMKTSSGIQLCYNAQIAVDSKSGLVLACEVSQDANDSSLLNPMMDEIEEMVGLKPDTTVADSGYCSAEQVALATEQKRKISLGMRNRAPKADEPFHSWLFERNEEANELECPIGGRLTFRGTNKTHSGKDTVERYRCVDHLDCPFAKICSKDPKGRVVEVSPHRQAILTQWKEQQESKEAQDSLSRRSPTVERVFGHIKRNLALKELEHRGLDTVKAVWILAILATNLTTLYKIWSQA